MDIKFDKDSADSNQTSGDNKGKQNILLVLLLVLVGAFAYIYFFTGLIKPMPEQKVAEAPVVSQIAKKPLPPTDGAPPKADSGDAKKDTAPTASKPETVQGTSAAVVPAEVATAKTVSKETPKPKDELKSVEGLKKPLATDGKIEVKKPVQIEKKQPVVADSKPLPAKNIEKKPADMKKPVDKQSSVVTADAKVKKEQQKSAKKAASGKVTGSGPWTVLVGNYVLEGDMAADLARVRKAGLEAYIVPGAKKKVSMNRLLLAEFPNRESAQAELAKLKHLTADAFMIDNAGMHVVYAGSYLRDALAIAEKERLAAAGYKLTVKHVEVLIPTKNLTAGSFAEKGAAEDVLKKLRAAEVKATLSRQ